MINRFITIPAIGVLAIIAAARGAAVGRGEAPTPLPIPAGQAQMFIDDALIESHEGLRRTLHQPTKDDGGNVPVLALESEFDAGVSATLEANGSIVFDPRLEKWVMFAVAFAPQTADRTRIYRFTSPDAMNWVKGDDGQPEHIQFDLHDPETGTNATNTDVFACCYDAADAERPYKGWLWFANWGALEGLYLVESADGKTWTRGPCVCRLRTWSFQQAGRPLVGPGDVNSFFHDAASNRYLASIKFNAPEPIGPNKIYLRSRAYAFVNSLSEPIAPSAIDHVELVPAGAEANGDLPHDEYYGSTAWRYESLWLGGLKVWHGGGDYPYSAAGSAFLKLAVSRDGLEWQKVPFANEAGQPEVFVANGAEGGNGGRNDGGYMTEFSQGPLRIGNELIYYYGCSSYGKNEPTGLRVSGGGIFRARLRPDGFVSVDGGALTTRPLRFAGRDLVVNGAGPIQVTVRDELGAELDAAEISGDSVRHEVRFAGQSLGDIVAGRTVRLTFDVRDSGRLYSFQAR